MKKIFAWLLAAVMSVTQLTAVAFAEDTWAPTATSYTADFTNPAEVSKWQPIADADSSNAESLTVSNGVLTWKTSKEANMDILIFLSEFMVPLVIFYIVGFGVLSKRPVFDDFLKGVVRSGVVVHCH